MPNAITLTLDELRIAAAWAADCAERVLPLFEAQEPTNVRPHEAIEGAREFASGGKRAARLRVLSLAALAAARETNDNAAKFAARAACMAASVAYTHPLATAEQGKHILGPAVYTIFARELNESMEAGDVELLWAIETAPATVREILQRFPAQIQGNSRLAFRYFQLDAALRRVE